MVDGTKTDSHCNVIRQSIHAKWVKIQCFLEPFADSVAIECKIEPVAPVEKKAKQGSLN
jgi:hypothetical protein